MEHLTNRNMTKRTICSVATCDLLNNQLRLQLQEAPNAVNIRARNPQGVIDFAINLNCNDLSKFAHTTLEFVEDVISCAKSIEAIKDTKLDWDTEQKPAIDKLNQKISKIYANADYQELAALAKDAMQSQFFWSMRSFEVENEKIEKPDPFADGVVFSTQAETVTVATLTSQI